MRSVHVPNQICKHMVYSPTVANKAAPNIRIQSRGDTCRAINLSCGGWAEAPVKIARMTLTIKLDGNWSSFQLANSAPPLSVTDSAIAPSARMQHSWRGSKPKKHEFKQGPCLNTLGRGETRVHQTRIEEIALLPRRVCCSRLCAMPVQHARALEQAQRSTSPKKN